MRCGGFLEGGAQEFVHEFEVEAEQDLSGNPAEVSRCARASCSDRQTRSGASGRSLYVWLMDQQAAGALRRAAQEIQVS